MDTNAHAPVAMMIADAYSKIKKLEAENIKLKQQLAMRDELILELEKVREFYASPKSWDLYEFFTTKNKIDWVLMGGKLARTPLKHQALLDEIMLTTKDER